MIETVADAAAPTAIEGPMVTGLYVPTTHMLNAPPAAQKCDRVDSFARVRHGGPAGDRSKVRGSRNQRSAIPLRSIG
jgi:hypothetical protein